MTEEEWPPKAIREALQKRLTMYLRLLARKLKLEGRTKFLIDSEILVAQDDQPMLIFGPTKTVEGMRQALRSQEPAEGEEWKKE